MEVVIRSANEKDLFEILYIYNDAIVNTTAVYTYKPETLDARQDWLRKKEEQGIPVFVAEIRGCIAGFASYGQFRAWPAYEHTIEHSIYVHPTFRKMGVASMLLAQLIEAGREKKIHTLIAGIDSSNRVSINLHKKFGFEKTAHLKEVGFKFGRWLDLVFLQLILNPDATQPLSQ